MSSRNRKPFEEAEILGMAERLFRLGMEDPSTEKERGELLIATTDMALAKLIAEGSDMRAAAFYRSEDCRSECMLKACLCIRKARTENGRDLVNWVVKSVQNMAKTLLDRDVRDSLRLDRDFDLNTLPAKEMQ
jgi:hypothetical protein